VGKRVAGSLQNRGWRFAIGAQQRLWRGAEEFDIEEFDTEEFAQEWFQTQEAQKTTGVRSSTNEIC
jgi:hypothetical protein